MVDMEEYPFIFMNTPTSLQFLASAEMALMVWRCKYANTSHLYDRPRLFFKQKKFSCKEVLVVPVPSRIEAQINKKILSIGEELRNWIYFHSYDREFFDGNSTEAFCECFKHIVVDFSGSIGYKASAINMLNSGEFSDVVNYKIACTFCLEDQVKRFWPSVENDARIDVDFDHDTCYVSYWNGCMKSVGNSINNAELAKILMAQTIESCGYDGTAIEYFCKMLPHHERGSEFISLLLDYDESLYCPAFIYLSLSFHTLNRVQAEKVFKTTAHVILRSLLKSDHYFQFAHQLWTLMEHSVLENESKFYEVICELWGAVFNPDDEDYSNYTRRDHINDLLIEIWSPVSNELKAHISDTFLRDRLFNRCRGPSEFSQLYGHDMTFLLDLLSRSRNVYKEEMWKNEWQELALRSKPSHFEQSMRYCLTNDDAVELLKNQLTDFEDLFKWLIGEGFYADLKDYLMFCSKDAKQFQQLGKKVLESSLYFILQHDDDKVAKFDWFVGEVFANVQQDSDEFKLQMISSANCLKNLLAARQADEISSNDFSRIIRRFVNNEEELQLVKRKLFERCRTYSLDFIYEMGKFNANQWPKFLEWCTSSDHEEMSAFKRWLINVDVIFVAHLRNYLRGERYGGISDFPDHFLKWYFGNEKDAKYFKLQKIKNYMQIDFIRAKMEKDSIYVGGLMYRLLVWLFDNNIENVREFCKTCNVFIRTPARPGPSARRVRNDFENSTLARVFNSILK